jgi:aromatic ring hydroxylase
MYLSGSDYRESLRRYNPTVFVNGRRVESVADEPLLAPGIAGVAVTYNFALREDLAPWMRAKTGDDKTVNRIFAHIGKLLLGMQIYDMHRLAHEVSGGMVVALPGPDEATIRRPPAACRKH